MGAALTSLQQAQANIAALIVEITASPKPSYSVKGQSVSWGDYLAQLTKAQEDLRLQIAALGGPFEITSQVY